VANILTAQIAANALRCATDDPEMLDLLPQVDAYILNATGWDWSTDVPINPTAVAAARLLLVMWHEDPAMMAQRNAPLSFGLTACLAQLEALAHNHLTFQGRSGPGKCTLVGAMPGDTVTSLTGLIGCNGDQASLYEAVITVEDEIQQITTADLSKNWYRVLITPVGSL
jgi:hypothetical protein